MGMWVVVVLLGIGLLIPPVQATCTNNCSYPLGSCLSSWNACQCTAEAMGADCSLTASNFTTPVYSALVKSLMGVLLRQEWMILLNGSQHSIRVRWTVNSYNWFGGIFNPGWDGMTSGDSWVFWVSQSSRQTFLGDYWSFGRHEPQLDSKQDLQLINSWRDGIWQSVEFQRLLNTGDSNDIVLIPNTTVRFMWTTGSSSPNSNGPTSSSSMPKLSMHGYVGNVGQFQIDFITGDLKQLADGVRWPRGYYGALFALLVILVTPFGLILSRNCVQKSDLGRCMSKRPLLGLSSNTGFWSSCARYLGVDELNVQNYILSVVYISCNIGVIAVSAKEYSAIGRSWMYAFGHLLAMNLALTLLPATHNSPLLWLFNIGYDVAIAWHRRLGRVIFVLLIIHLVTMILIWDASVLFYLGDCQNGMGSLYGMIAGLCFLIMVFSSLKVVRRNAWTWFLRSHLVLAIIGYVFAMMHSYNLRWLLLVPGALSVFDILLRYSINPVVRYGHLTRLSGFECLGEGKGTQVTVLTLETKASRVKIPNAHVYLRIPSVAPFQLHPFTISSIEPTCDTSGKVEKYRIRVHVMVRTGSKGAWTRRLYELCSSYLSKSGVPKKIDFDVVEGTDMETALREPPFTVLIDGPYSSLSLPLFEFKVIVLVAGGIGVTPCMNLITYYLKHDQSLSTKCIHLLWVSRNRSSFSDWFPEELRRLRADESQRIRIDLHDTSNVLQLGSMESEAPNEGDALPEVAMGRPNLAQYLAQVLSTSMEQGFTSRDIVVFSCGPKPLVDEMEREADLLGIHATHEAFSY